MVIFLELLFILTAVIFPHEYATFYLLCPIVTFSSFYYKQCAVSIPGRWAFPSVTSVESTCMLHFVCSGPSP